jgi:hypothetical protein
VVTDTAAAMRELFAQMADMGHHSESRTPEYEALREYARKIGVWGWAPADVSYDEDSPWCQEHGHTGLLVGDVCETCNCLVRTDPRFAALVGTVHNPDGSRGAR